MSKPRWLKPPDDFGEKAITVWRRYANSRYATGHLTRESLDDFKNLCRLLAIVEAAAGEIERDGVTIVAGTGSRKANPAVAILLGAERQVARLLKAFDLEPAWHPLPPGRHF